MINEVIHEVTGAAMKKDCECCGYKKLFYTVAAYDGRYLCLACGETAAGPLYRWSLRRQRYEEVPR